MIDDLELALSHPLYLRLSGKWLWMMSITNPKRSSDRKLSKLCSISLISTFFFHCFFPFLLMIAVVLSYLGDKFGQLSIVRYSLHKKKKKKKKKKNLKKLFSLVESYFYFIGKKQRALPKSTKTQTKKAKSRSKESISLYYNFNDCSRIQSLP
jgi:hypothetical protein